MRILARLLGVAAVLLCALAIERSYLAAMDRAPGPVSNSRS